MTGDYCDPLQLGPGDYVYCHQHSGRKYANCLNTFKSHIYGRRFRSSSSHFLIFFFLFYSPRTKYLGLKMKYTITWHLIIRKNIWIINKRLQNHFILASSASPSPASARSGRPKQVGAKPQAGARPHNTGRSPSGACGFWFPSPTVELWWQLSPHIALLYCSYRGVRYVLPFLLRSKYARNTLFFCKISTLLVIIRRHSLLHVGWCIWYKIL